MVAKVAPSDLQFFLIIRLIFVTRGSGVRSLSPLALPSCVRLGSVFFSCCVCFVFVFPRLGSS